MKLQELKEEVLKNISEGKTYSNYPELCKALKQKTKTGKSKVLQLEDWKRYFDFERITTGDRNNRGYLIKKIYDTPLAKPLNKNAIFIKLIELLLMNELSTKQDCTCDYTTTKLYKILGMVNQRYYENKGDDKDEYISTLYKDNMWQVDNFYNRTNKKLNEILFSALNSMKKRMLLVYYEIYIIVVEDAETKSDVHIEATISQIDEILECQKSVLIEMGVPKVDAKDDNDKKIPFGRYKEFYDKVNKKLYDLHGWKCAYREYRLIYTRKYISHDIPIVVKEIDTLVKDSKQELNLGILKTINRQADALYEKNSNGFQDWAMYGTDAPNFMLPNDYPDVQAEIADYLIRL